MWAPNLDDQFRVLKGGVSPATIPGGTAGYSPFVEPTTGASTQLDSVDVTKPGIADSWLRTVVVNWAGSKDSGLTSAQTAAVIEFATCGALPTPAAKTLVCEALKKLMAPETINRLGISSIDVQAVVAQVASMTLNADPLNAAADDFRKKSMAENGYTPTEVKFRNRMGLISPKNSNVQTILQEMTREGTLKKGMSESDIATAVTTYVQTHFNYISDGVTVEGKSADHWNTINETMAAKGGDCEDLSILTASLLMGALSKSGVSDEAIHRKVTLAAGYLVDKTGAAKGHATVKFVLEDGKSLALDATSNKPPVAFDSLGMVLVLEGNDTTFKQYKAIDEFFETALGLNAFDTHGTIEKINDKLTELKDMLANPVEVPLASADGKSFTYFDSVTGGEKDITQHPNWKNNSIDFGFYTLSKTQISDFGGTWHSDMYVTKINEATFYDFMSQSRDLINRAVMMFNVVNMVLEFDEHQANEIGVSGFEDYEKSELLETMDSAAKYKNRFVNAMNGSLGKISSSIETVVNEMFLFISGANSSQQARINAELQEYGRGNIGVGILSGIADELTGAFSFVRATATLNLTSEMAKINLANAEAYVRYTMKFGAGISLWDTSALTPEASEMIGDSEQKKTDIRLTLQRGLNNLTSMDGKFDDIRSPDLGASLGVGQSDSNDGTVALHNLNFLGKSGNRGQYVEFGMNYILRLRDSMVDYQNFLRSTYMITEAEKSAKRQVAEQISSTSGLQDGAKGTSSTTQTKGVVVNAMSTELQRQTSGLSQIDLMTRPFVDSSNEFINARYGYAMWFKDLAGKLQMGIEIGVNIAASIFGATLGASLKLLMAPVYLLALDPVGSTLYGEVVGDFVSNAVPDLVNAASNLVLQGVYYDLEVNENNTKNTNLMVQEGSGYGASGNLNGLNSSNNTATQNASSVNPYDTSTGNYYIGKMESLLYDARHRYDNATGETELNASVSKEKFILDSKGEESMQTTAFMANRGDGMVVLKGAAMASQQTATSMDYMKVSIYLSVMKALQDAMEGVTATMFGRSKTSTVSSFDGQIDAIVGKESSIVDAYRAENQSRVQTINSQQSDSKRNFNAQVELIRAGVRLGVQLTRAGVELFVMIPTPAVQYAPFAAYVGMEVAVTVATGIDEAANLVTTAYGKYGYENIDYDKKDAYEGNAVNPQFVNRLRDNANPGKYGSTPSVGDRYLRLDEKEAVQLKGIQDPNDILTESNSMAEMAGEFQQIDFKKLLDAYKEMTQINQVRTFMTMIDQAMYNAKQNTLRAMFGGNATGNHQALSVMASAIDRYVGSVMGTFSGQTGVFQDFITEASGRMTAINDRVTGELNGVISGTVTAGALALQLVGLGFFRSVGKGAKLPGTGGLSTENYLAKVRKIMRGSFISGMVSSIAKIALGVQMMNSVKANNPQITSQLLNYEEDPDNSPPGNSADTVEEQKKNAKLRGSPADSSLNPDEKNPVNAGKKESAGQNFDITEKGSVESAGLKQKVNTSDKTRAERMVSRQSRTIQVLRDISLALSDAKGDAAEDMGGGSSAKNAYRSMNSILNQQTNLEQQSVGLIFQALEAQVAANNRGVDFVISGASGVVSAGLTKAVGYVAKNLTSKTDKTEPDAETKVKKTTDTDIDTAAPTAAPTATATPKPAAPANNIQSVDSSSKAKTSNPNKKLFTPYQLQQLDKVMKLIAPTLGLIITDALMQALPGGRGSQMYSEDKAEFGLEKDDYFKDGGNIQQKGGEKSGATSGRAETKGSVGFMDTSQLETAMFANALLSAGYDVRGAKFANMGELYDSAGKGTAGAMRELFKDRLKKRLAKNAQEAENKTADDLVKDHGEEALIQMVLGVVNKAIGESGATSPPLSIAQTRLIQKLFVVTGTKEESVKAVVDQLRAGALTREKVADGRSAGTGSVGQMGAQRAGLMGIIQLRDALEKMESAGAAADLTKDLKVLLGTATGSTAGINSAATALGLSNEGVSAALKNITVGSNYQPSERFRDAMFVAATATVAAPGAIRAALAATGGAIRAARAATGGAIRAAGAAIGGVFTKAVDAYTTAAAPVAAPVGAGPFAAGISEMASVASGVWAALGSVGTDLVKGLRDAVVARWDALQIKAQVSGSLSTAASALRSGLDSAVTYVGGAVKNKLSASTAIMKDGKYTDYFMGLDVDQRTKLLVSEFKKAGGVPALSQELADLAANMAASADRKGFQAKSDALLAKVGKSMEANLVSQPGGVGDDNRNKILAMSHLEQALIGMASYNLSLDVSARLAGTTLDQSGLSRADLKLAQAVLDANGLGNSPSVGERFLRGAVAVVSLNMLEVDPKRAAAIGRVGTNAYEAIGRVGANPVEAIGRVGTNAVAAYRDESAPITRAAGWVLNLGKGLLGAGRAVLSAGAYVVEGLRWGSGPVSAATSAIGSAIGSARSGLDRLAGNFFGRGSEFKYKAASEVGTRALDKTKLDAFLIPNRDALMDTLKGVFERTGGNPADKAKQVMDVLTGEATRAAVGKLNDSVSRDKLDIKQQKRRVLFLASGNAGSEILKLLKDIEDVGLKARQKSIESYSFELKENALEVHDLVSGAGTQRDDAYAAEGRGFDRRTAAVAFADIKDAALGTSRFETRGTEFAKKFKEAKDNTQRLDKVLEGGIKQRWVGDDSATAGGWTQFGTQVFSLFVRNPQKVKGADSDYPDRFSSSKDVTKDRDAQLTQMYDVERGFRAELTHLIVTHDDKRAGEMIKGALGSGKEGRELVSRVMQGLAVQDMAYGSAMFKRVMETTIARYSGNHEVMSGLGEAVATAVEKAGVGPKPQAPGWRDEIVNSISAVLWGEAPATQHSGRSAGLTMENPGYPERAYRSVHDVLFGDFARGVTAKQVGDSFAASLGDSDVSRAVMGRGWLGKNAPVADDGRQVVDSSNIKLVEERMANAVAGQLSEIKGFGTLASHMGDVDMKRMVGALDPDKKDKLIKFVEAGSEVTEFDKQRMILDKAVDEYSNGSKSPADTQKLNTELEKYAKSAVIEFSQMISREMADGSSRERDKSRAWGLKVIEKAAARVEDVEKLMDDSTLSISKSIREVAQKVAAVPLPQGPMTEAARLAHVRKVATDLNFSKTSKNDARSLDDIDAQITRRRRDVNIVRNLSPASSTFTTNPMFQVIDTTSPETSIMESNFLSEIVSVIKRGDHNKPLAALSGETMLALSKLRASDDKVEVEAFKGRLKSVAEAFDAQPAAGQSHDDWMSLKKEQYEDYSKNTKPGTYSDFSDLNRSPEAVAPTPPELKTRANGVLQKVLELSATGDFGSINQLLGNIGRTGGASGNLLIEMVGVELRRLGKNQQLEAYLKQSGAKSEEMIKTVSLDKKFQQDAKDKFGEALRGNTNPDTLDSAMTFDNLAGMKEDLDRSEALVSLANELGGSPAKLGAVMSDPSAVGLLGKLLAQGAAMYLPGAKRLIDTLLKMEDKSAYGLQELGEAVADAGLRIDYVRGDATVSVREEIEKLVTEVKDAQIKLESKPEVKGPIAEKAEGFVTAIKIGYQGRPVAPLSEKARVTQAKIMLLGGLAAVDKAKSDFQNFARVDPTGAAILIKDLDTVTPNHANTLLTGFNTKNLSPSDAVGLATALAAAAEATGDKALTPETSGAVNTAKKEVDAFIAANPDISPNPKTRQITQNVMAGSDFKAQVSALATDLAGKLDDGGRMKALAGKMIAGTISKEELGEFYDGIKGLEPETQQPARELAHLVLADTNRPLFLVTHTINAGRNGASTMLSSDTVRGELKAALADKPIPSEGDILSEGGIPSGTRMECAATLARGAILGGVPIDDMAETLANLVMGSANNPDSTVSSARSELLKSGSASAEAIRAHIQGKTDEASVALRKEMNPAVETFKAITTDLGKVAFMGDPVKANRLATESPGTYVSFLMSPAADGLVNGDQAGLRALFGEPAAELGQRIAAASPRTLVLAEAATGCIKLSMRAAIATGNDADADVFIAGCKTAATGIAADFTTPGATGLEGLQEMALQTLDSLKSAGQVVAQRNQGLGGELIKLANQIKTKLNPEGTNFSKLNEFCATVSARDPQLGETLSKAVKAGTTELDALIRLSAAIDTNGVSLPKKDDVLRILCAGFAAGSIGLGGSR